MSSASTAVRPVVPWLAHLQRETERFAEVVRKSPPRVHVPAGSARVSDGRLTPEQAPDRPSGTAVAVTGAAQDIALLVWKRALPPRPELEVAGDAHVLKRFLVTDYIPDPRTTPAH
jgi:hypothetical protein